MASTLTTDTYIIRSLSSKDGEYVGRSKTEDFSLGPKRVIALPQGIQAPEVGATPLNRTTVLKSKL